MKDSEEELPEDLQQSVIMNSDAVFENSSVDPGFVFDEAREDLDNGKTEDSNVDTNNTQNIEKAVVDKNRSTKGLDELDGTNPGSNYHPMD